MSGEWERVWEGKYSVLNVRDLIVDHSILLTDCLFPFLDGFLLFFLFDFLVFNKEGTSLFLK